MLSTYLPDRARAGIAVNRFIRLDYVFIARKDYYVSKPDSPSITGRSAALSRKISYGFTAQETARLTLV